MVVLSVTDSFLSKVWIREVRVCLCNEKQCPSSSAYANISWGADSQNCAPWKLALQAGQLAVQKKILVV